MKRATNQNLGYHEKGDIFSRKEITPSYNEDLEFTYTFKNFFHPFVGDLIEKLNKESLNGMLDAKFHKLLKKDSEFFKTYYESLNSRLVKIKFSDKEIALNHEDPYANYNWELLYHIPITIAVHLSKNQRFAEAQRWFHYIFDPTSNETSEPVPKRFWKFLAFQDDSDLRQIDELLELLSKTEPSDNKKSILDGYETIKNKPFQPHAVARTRLLAYKYNVVMKYLDNLIAWGDSLYRQDTIESINEATLRYVLAANILGARPQKNPSRGDTRPMSFNDLKKGGLDAMGNLLVDLEGKFPMNYGTPQTQNQDLTGPLFGIGHALFFCIPRNEKMLGYWDTVADRLYKIHNSLNIEGVFRQLALFDPPIDPGMLVKAAAAGIDIGSVVNGLNQPISPLRSLLLIQKSLELCSEVRSLGSTLLSAIEKGDGEHIALLRQNHEIKIQQMTQDVRFLQWKQAQEATTSLLTSRLTALERFHYYQRLLGFPADENAPEIIALDRRELTEENFEDAYTSLVVQYDKDVKAKKYPKIKLAGDTSPNILSGYSGSGKLYLTKNEHTELNIHLPLARDLRLVASAANFIAAAVTPIPSIYIDAQFWGIGAHSEVGSGERLASILKTFAEIAQLGSAWEQDQAGMTSRFASYERRADEWLLQYNLSAHELMQIGRQILTSLISEQIAHHEYLIIQNQIIHSQEVNQFLQDKFSNEELYAWMQGEISRLYYEYYRFAFDTARKAEQTMKRELMRPEVDSKDYIKFNYWDSGRKGLLSGETLYLDVKRMEMAYLENNKREYELIKNISLRQLNPLAILVLKATGSCEVTIPEWLYDMDCPGHFMRRIKNVSLSIPSITGPFTSINCTLTLLKSSLRKSSLLKDDSYERQGEDDRFIDYLGTIQSIVTSSANNDSGLFETNLRDEQILPFEGAGAESTWRLELPNNFRQFDYNTISDIILHMRYTARQGGNQLRDMAVANLEEIIGVADNSSWALMISPSHDFPNEWNQFVSGGLNFKATIKRDHFPYFTLDKDISIDAIKIHAIKNRQVSSVTPPDINMQNITVAFKATGEFQLSLTPDDKVLTPEQSNIFVTIKYSVGNF